MGLAARLPEHRTKSQYRSGNIIKRAPRRHPSHPRDTHLGPTRLAEIAAPFWIDGFTPGQEPAQGQSRGRKPNATRAIGIQIAHRSQCTGVHGWPEHPRHACF